MINRRNEATNPREEEPRQLAESIEEIHALPPEGDDRPSNGYKRVLQTLRDYRGTGEMQYNEILRKLESLSNPRAVAGMARFGISTKNAYGVSIPQLRVIAKGTGRNHLLAQQLWSSGIHEARILAGMIDEPELVTDEQMERWVRDFDSWDVCDQCCSNLFDKTQFAHQKAVEWSQRNEEFVKRAGFALMAALAVHDKEAKDQAFLKFLPVIKSMATDDRNLIKKAVNWALRAIGKQNRHLNKMAVRAAKEIQAMPSRTAKWIASDALRELTSARFQKRLRE